MAFEQIGVQAVLAGISAFQSDANRFNRSVGDMASTVKNVATAPVRALTGFLGSLGESIRRVGEIALGIIVANTIGRIADFLRDAARAAIDAAAQFQQLTIQVEGLLARQFVQTGAAETFTQGLQMAQGAARELLDWIKLVAVETPFSTESLSRVVAMALGAGFATEKTQDLALAIGNFTSGMGLGNQEMERIMLNFQQMVLQGKVTGRELRDLAVGALVPVNDVLRQMQIDLGMTNMSLDDFRKKAAAGAVPVEAFFDAFITLANNEFPGASERMTRTLLGLQEKVSDFIKTFIGAEVILPVLDRLSARGSQFIDSLLTEDTLMAARGLGEELASLAGTILDDLLPALGLSVDIDVPGFLKGITEFVRNFREQGIPQIRAEIERLLGAFRTGGVFGLAEALGIDPQVIATVQRFIDDVVQSFSNLVAFWSTNGPAIVAAITQVMDALFQTGAEEGGGLLTSFTQYLIDRGPELVEIIQSIANFITETLLPAIRNFVAFLQSDAGQRLLEFIAVTALVSSALGVLFGTIVALALSIPGIFAGMIAAVILAFTLWKDDIANWLNTTADNILAWVLLTVLQFIGWIESVKATIVNAIPDFIQLGRDLIDGIKQGLVEKAVALAQAAAKAALDAYNAARKALGFGSPSKLFMDIGRGVMDSMARGIIDGMGAPAIAAKIAALNVVAPAAQVAAVPSQISNSTTNNFNLNVATNAPVEPILADFRLMQGLSSVG